MLRKDATQYCKEHAIELLQRAKKRGFVCELCGSGTGAKGTGLEQGKKNPSIFSCFACGFSGDIFDYVAKRDGLQKGSKDAFERVYSLFGITIEEEQNTTPSEAPRSSQEQKSESLLDKFKLWNKDISKCEYLKNRGISLQVANKYLLGFTRLWFGAHGDYEEALVIPTGESSYSARNTNKDTEQYQRYTKKGKTSLFNKKALRSGGYVFVTEGELDALSIIEAGGEALGLGSTSNIDLLISELKQNAPKGLILGLDNDKQGVIASGTFKEKLEKNGIFIPVYIINLYGEYKDANETLVKNRKLLEDNVARAKKNPLKYDYQSKNKNDFEELQGFWERSHDMSRSKLYSTGFEQLDKALGGGIGTGLTGLGAISSLGKTTLVSQMACNFAMSGADVLFFSLEQGRDELIAKNISRLTAVCSKALVNDTQQACTSREILRAYNWNKLDTYKQATILYAFKQYERDIAKHIYTIEGELDYNVEDIVDKITEHIEVTGNKPIVIVDYLQILGLREQKTVTDKMKADILVKKLRIIARKFDIPVIAISSFNRENYNTPVSMSSFKESGGIEYTSDCLIGLQFAFMEPQGDEDAESKKYKSRIRQEKKNTRINKKNGLPIEVQAVILKSRYSGGGDANFLFAPKYNYYMQLDESGNTPKIKGYDKELWEQCCKDVDNKLF